MSRTTTRKPSRRSPLRRARQIAAVHLAAATLVLPLPADAQTASQAKTQQNQPQSPRQSQPATQQPPAPRQSQSSAPITPGATVLFERSMPDATQPQEPGAQSQPAPAQQQIDANTDDPLHVTDAERESITFTRYDLDLRLTPAGSDLSARAAMTLRNDGAVPLTRLALQLTSTAHWDAISTTNAAGGAAPLHFTARRIATDADHTGWAEEAVVTLVQPLAPGASLPLIALYSGTIAASADRLERIGAPPEQATSADWDAIAAVAPLAGGTSVALRGFGNVLWYPVAAAPVFLGDGARLFDAVARTRRREAAATVRLRLAVEFTGDPPDAAFFCGRREPLKALYDNPGTPIAESTGIATADFSAEPLGTRTLSLFVTTHPPTGIGTPKNGSLIAAVTDRNDALAWYSAAAAEVEPLLADWFGAHPLGILNLIDHAGQPFEAGTLLVRPLRPAPAKELAPELAHSLAHAWIGSGSSPRPAWIDEGLAQFAELLWIERSQGREAALSALQSSYSALSLAESLPAGTSSGSSPDALPTRETSLTDAGSEVYFRTKAAAVWWMLRSLAGDDALKQAIQSYCHASQPDSDPTAFERTLERFAHKDLHWFFDNWVYNDRGLPDLSIVNVAPRQLEAHNGLPAGWLVAVEMRNDGTAEAEVPLIVRSTIDTPGQRPSIESERIRIPPHTMLSRRIVFPGTPDEVQLNDGSVPEVGTNLHVRKLSLSPQ